MKPRKIAAPAVFASCVVGVAGDQRLYQLIRQTRPIRDRRFEIEFLDAGEEIFAFTFGRRVADGEVVGALSGKEPS